MLTALLTITIVILLITSVIVYLNNKNKVLFLKELQDNKETQSANLELKSKELISSVDLQIKGVNSQIENLKEVQMSMIHKIDSLGETLNVCIKSNETSLSSVISNSHKSTTEFIAENIKELLIVIEKIKSETGIKMEETQRINQKLNESFYKEVQQKFNDILSEIKSPLTLD